MISFLCPHCGAPLRVRAELAGSSGKCPRCGKPIEAPTDAASSGRNSPQKPAPAGGKDRPTFEAAERDDDLSFLGSGQGSGELGRLGGYRVLRVLGQGGMGIVFLGEDINLKRQVALKVMRKEQAASQENRLRFRREAQAAAAIEHDNIVTIYQVGEERGVPFLAMKLLKGESLEDRLNRMTKLPLEQVLRIGAEIAAGLAEAHERGLIHRDIKPANIWLEEGNDRVKIVDFGLARASEEDVQLTRENYMVGTPMYMSPEQAEGDVIVDHRCDLFSLGSVLYRMSTGELPFKGKNTMAVLTALATKIPTPPRDLNPDLPRSFSDLVMQLLSKDPADRPKNARQVVARLEEIRQAPGDYEEVEEDLVVEEHPEEVDEPLEEIQERPRPEPRPRRKPKRRESPSDHEPVNPWERRVITLGIVAIVLIVIVVVVIVVRGILRKREEKGALPTVFPTSRLSVSGSIGCVARGPVSSPVGSMTDGRTSLID